MHVALIIAGSLVCVGMVLYIHHRLTFKQLENTSVEDDETPKSDADADCCGMHITCERDSLSPVFANEIEYFDDEELDVYADFSVSDYTDEDIENFRDVLLTLRPNEIAPWARSIQQRGITLPDVVRDELFIIVEEARNRLAPHAS